MSLNSLRSIRGFLVSSSNITNTVPATRILVSWPQVINTYPTIILTQVGGTDIGNLGYRTAAAGTRLRKENSMIQIDVFSKTSRKETLDIADNIVPLLIASGGCRKTTDMDMYDDDTKVYRKSQTFNYTVFYDD